MKKLSKLLTLFVGMLTIGLTTGVAYGATSFSNIEKADAAGESTYYAYLYESAWGGWGGITWARFMDSGKSQHKDVSADYLGGKISGTSATNICVASVSTSWEPKYVIFVRGGSVGDWSYGGYKQTSDLPYTSGEHQTFYITTQDYNHDGEAGDKIYHVSATSNGNGTVSTDYEHALQNNNVKFTATANNGYHFKKWSDDSTTNPYSKKITSNTSLSATFEKDAADTYTVAFNCGTGSGTMASRTVEVGQTITAPNPSPSFTAPAHQKFEHWSGSNGNTYAIGATIPSQTKNTTIALTAIWQDFSPADGWYAKGTINGVANSLVTMTKSGDEYKLLNQAYKVGDSFQVVEYSAESIITYIGGEQLENVDGSAIKENQVHNGTGDKVTIDVAGTYDLYAKPKNDSNKLWMPKITYKIIYNSNTGTGSYGPIYPSVGKAFTTAPKNTFTAPTGKIFKEWNTAANGSGTGYAENVEVTGSDSYAQNSEHTLYAIWEDMVPNGTYLRGTFQGANKWTKVGQKTMTTNPDNNHEQMYKGLPLTANDAVKVITYTDGVGTYHSAQSTSIDGTGYTKPDIDGSGNAVIYEQGVFNVYVNTYDVDPVGTRWNYHFYALRIHYNANTGSGTMSSSYPTQANFNAKVDSNTFTAPAGHSFKEWNTAADGSGTKYTVGQLIDFSSRTENFELYAIWESSQTEITLNLNHNGGTSAQNTVTVMQGEKIDQVAVPTKLNNIFDGYYSGSTSDTQYIDNTGKGSKNVDLSDGDTLYAWWHLEEGKYLWVKTIDGDTHEGTRKMELNGETGTQYVYRDIHLDANEEIRVYFQDNTFGDISTITWSHPSFQGTFKDGNCQVKKEGDYDIYYDTTTKEMRLTARGYAENGRYIAVNAPSSGDIPATYLRNTEQVQGYTGTEYMATIDLKAGDEIRAYYQETTENTKVYDALLDPLSPIVFEYKEGQGLICPTEGTYTFYLFSKDGGANYNYISISNAIGEKEAIEFANEFNTAIGGYCQTGDIDNVISAWETLSGSEKYGKLPDASKNILKNAIADEHGTVIQQFAAKYDYVFSKYHTQLDDNDFADRFENIKLPPSNLRHYGFSFGESEDQTVLIIIIASAGLLLTGAATTLLLLKKKKKAK